MLQRKAASEKILLLGVDGMDPRYTRYMVDQGKMPAVAEYIKRGACREDLTMLGGHPTVTPPMWTTLATGAYANVHGITGFFRCGSDIDVMDYNMDSRLCKAELLWNVFAEAGKKTLVFHWPGSAWPPTSDSDNLFVVDGSSPGTVAMSVAQVEHEFIVAASEIIPELRFIPKAPMEASSACIITDLDLDDKKEESAISLSNGLRLYIDDINQMNWISSEDLVDIAQSPIKSADGWDNAPADAKEFTILLSGGLIRRPALILKNENGVYDTVAVYKNKKSTEALAILPVGEMVVGIVDEAYRGDKKFEVNRNLKLIKMEPDGSALTIYVSAAMDIHNDLVYSPKRLHKVLSDNIGYPPPTSSLGRQDTMLITDCMLSTWDVVADWQAKSIQYLIETEGIEVVFSHYHNIDLEAHKFIKHLADREFNRNPVEVAEKWMEDIYTQTDRYLGQFLHYLDEGWTVIVFSDHAQVAPAHDVPEGLIHCEGIGITLMEEMGYTVPIKNEKGRTIGIDWTKTKAVSQREGNIYLNLKGRNKHTLADGTVIDGIVDPAEQYELEEEIMTKLYQLTDKKTGHRIVSVALRNRDAVLLGYGGPECGDICCWLAEGYNNDHADSLSTAYGEGNTSVSPIFIAAGKGIKPGYTERIIRQIDFAPTVAVLGGVRMPKHCEGAPAYQILENEY